MNKLGAGLVVVFVAAAVAGCNKSSGLGGFEGEISMQTTRAGGSPNTMLVSTKGDKLRFDMSTPDGQKSHAVFDPAANKMTMFMDGQKAYMDMDFSSPSATPNTDPGTAKVEKSGKHETVAGLDCEDWTVNDASGKKTELCIAQGIAYFDVNGLRPGAQGAVSPLAKQFRDEKSFPLRSVEYDTQGKEVSRSEVTKVDKKKLDDTVFAVPADYKKIEIPKLAPLPIGAAVPNIPDPTAAPPPGRVGMAPAHPPPNLK